MRKKEKRIKRLALHEIQSIFVMRKAGKTIQEIASLIKRSKSTISDCLNLYCHPNRITWYNMNSYERAIHVCNEMQANKKGKKRFGQLKDHEIKEYVYDKLVNVEQTPEMIAGRMKYDLPGKSICFKTIYNYIKRSDPELKVHLYEKGKKRRQRVVERRGRFKQGSPKKHGIDEREEVINKRDRTGDWEVDTIVACKNGSGAILSLVERLTREKYIQKISDLKADTVFAYLRAFMIKHNAKSLTLDNGGEFAYSRVKKLESLYPGLKIYYCDAYKSYQKGSVERSNRDVRIYFPKGTDFSEVTKEQVAKVQDKLNNRPLKLHGFLSPMEAKKIYIELEYGGELASCNCQHGLHQASGQPSWQQAV